VEICERSYTDTADRQTDRQTDALITILHTAPNWDLPYLLVVVEVVELPVTVTDLPDI